MASSSRIKAFYLLISNAFACLFVIVAISVTEVGVISVSAARAETTRTQAIAIVNSILSANADACKLKHGPIAATRVKAGWRVTTRVTMSGGGKPFSATAVWTVRDGEAVPGNQLSAEISQGCP